MIYSVNKRIYWQVVWNIPPAVGDGRGEHYIRGRRRSSVRGVAWGSCTYLFALYHLCLPYSNSYFLLCRRNWRPSRSDSQEVTNLGTFDVLPIALTSDVTDSQGEQKGGTRLTTLNRSEWRSIIMQWYHYWHASCSAVRIYYYIILLFTCTNNVEGPSLTTTTLYYS